MFLEESPDSIAEMGLTSTGGTETMTLVMQHQQMSSTVANRLMEEERGKEWSVVLILQRRQQ